MEVLNNFAKNAAKTTKPFKRAMNMEMNKKYKIISIQSVTTNFGPRYRIETEEFKFELPARFNTLPEEVKTALLNKAKFVTYKGRDREDASLSICLILKV